MDMEQQGRCMRSIGMKALLVLALLGAGPLASAAGFDCTQAKGLAEQYICSDAQLSQLDDQMTQAFAQARARAGKQTDALLRDQRNWLAERNEVIPQDAQLSASSYQQNMASLYQQRIAFLEHVFSDRPADPPLLVAIVKHLASESPVKTDSPYVDWQLALGGGTVFQSATEQPFDASKPSPLDTTSLSKIAAQKYVDLSSNVKLFQLDALHLGGLYSVAGTADCVSVALFSWYDHAVQAIPVPKTLGENCWTLHGGLVGFQGQAYALQSDESNVVASDMQTQQWQDGHWTKPERVLVRYDYLMLPRSVHCEQVDCPGLIALADRMLERYDRSRDVHVLSGDIPADARTQWDALRERARNNPDLQDVPFVDMPSGIRGWSGFGSFDGDGLFFPVRWQGEWMLGRIGHASLGWRTSADWLLGIWRWNGHAFEPVLGMAAPIRRGDFLLSAWMPPRPHVNP
jgi:uncharacterized protein